MSFDEEIRKSAHIGVVAQLQGKLGIKTNINYLLTLQEDKLERIRDFLVIKYNEQVENESQNRTAGI